MLKLEKWDPRTEGPTPPIVADEAFIKKALDGTFMWWRANDWTFEPIEVEPDFVPKYRPLQTIFQNQYGTTEPVDDNKVRLLFEATMRLYKVDAETMRARNRHGGRMAKIHPAQKVFVLACMELMNAPMHQIGAWLNRDSVSAYEIRRAAVHHRVEFKPRIAEVAKVLE